MAKRSADYDISVSSNPCYEQTDVMITITDNEAYEVNHSVIQKTRPSSDEVYIESLCPPADYEIPVSSYQEKEQTKLSGDLLEYLKVIDEGDNGSTTKRISTVRLPADYEIPVSSYETMESVLSDNGSTTKRISTVRLPADYEMPVSSYEIMESVSTKSTDNPLGIIIDESGDSPSTSKVSAVTNIAHHATVNTKQLDLPVENNVLDKEVDAIVSPNQSYVQVLPQNQHLVKKKGIKSCLHQDLTTKEYVIGAVAIISIILSSITIGMGITMPTKQIFIPGNATVQEERKENLINVCNCSVPSFPINRFSSQLVELLLISQELEQLKFNQNTSVIGTRQQLHNLLSQIKAINNSIEQIRPLSNQPRSPHITGINLLSSVSINIIDRCTITGENPCVVNVPEFAEIASCIGGDAPIINDEGIVVDFICQTSPLQNSANISINTSTSIDRHVNSGETISNPDDIMEVFKKSKFRCYCFNFGTVQARCQLFVTRCPFIYGTLNTTIQT